jgi:two-component system, sporulation sensor kinase E
MIQNPFKNSKTFDLYRNKGRYKWIIFFMAAIIGLTSIYYTNLLVTQLKDREKRLIELYANTLEYNANQKDNENLGFIFQEIIVPNNSIPVILTDGGGNPIDYRNLPVKSSFEEVEKQEFLRNELEIMKEEHEPIMIRFENNDGMTYSYNYVYYKNSKLLDQLRYYPYVQLSIITIFGVLAYLAFNYSKTAEQNRIWVGLAKETAHQLGTPISSLMAWLEYFKSVEKIRDKELVQELEKDVSRLEMITSRFSNIGSTPLLNYEDIHQAVRNTVNYLQKRISSKITFSVNALPVDIRAKINKPLFDWVIENLCKNAVDAMGGEGTIDINIRKAPDDNVMIDISDTGKGIPKSKIRDVFSPGYTTKSRGWGLGLTLVKRIVENYHQGKIFVKSSEPEVGTTFRIILKV